MNIKPQPRQPRPVSEGWPAGPDPEQILRDWQRFIYSGFQRLFFTRALSTFLHRQCAFAQPDQETFWRRYFDAETIRLRAFLNQFGGDLRSAEYGTRAWLGGPEAELKEAMCEQMAELNAPLSQVLADLEGRHEELIAVWGDFAAQAGVPEPGRPPPHRLSANSRSLLAYAAGIAFKVQHPLAGLQLHLLPASSPRSLPLPGGLDQRPVEVTWLD